MSIWRYLSLFISGFSIFLLSSSCTKKPEAIGLDLVDENKPGVVFDTSFNMNVYSLREDSVQSDETSVNLLGSIYTETFGRTNAGFYSHLRISALTPEWGENPIADSVILSMVYSGYYGNLNTELTVRMYRVLEDMHWDSSYWSNHVFDTSNVEMAIHTFLPDLTEIPEIDTTGEEPDTSFKNAELRIPVDLSFAQEMFDLDTSNTSSSDAFLEYFKGIYLRTDEVTSPGDGSILYFDMLDNRSKLTIYYQNDSTDSLSFDFLINLNNARINRYDHAYSLSTDPDFINMVINGDTTLGEENLYLQCMGGVKTNIRFPEILDWGGASSRVINEAKLIIPLKEEYTEDYEPSTSLILFKNLADGGFDFVPDQLQGENYFDGKYDEATNSYTFRISLHIQDLLKGEPDYGLGLFPNAKSIRATGMKLFGTNTVNPQRLKLQITYTEVE